MENKSLLKATSPHRALISAYLCEYNAELQPALSDEELVIRAFIEFRAADMKAGSVPERKRSARKRKRLRAEKPYMALPKPSDEELVLRALAEFKAVDEKAVSQSLLTQAVWEGRKKSLSLEARETKSLEACARSFRTNFAANISMGTGNRNVGVNVRSTFDNLEEDENMVKSGAYSWKEDADEVDMTEQVDTAGSQTADGRDGQRSWMLRILWLIGGWIRLRWHRASGLYRRRCFFLSRIC